MKRFAILLAAIFATLLCCSLALAGSGTLTISGVTDNEDETYDLALTSVSGIAVGDYLLAQLASGRGGIYEVSAIDTATVTVTVTDTLTDDEGAAFGAPIAGSGSYFTPTTGAVELARPPYSARGWDAAHRLNFERLSRRVGLLAYSGEASVSSSTGSYAAARSVTIPAGYLDVVGAAVRIKANIRQATGSGVNLRCDVGGTNCTALTAVGLVEIILVRTNADSSNGMSVLSAVVGSSAQFAKDDLTGLNYTAAIEVALEVQGGDAAGGTATDFWLVERLR